MSGGGLSGGFQTTTKTMDDVQNDFKTVYSDLNKRFDQLQNDMQAVRAKWKGPAGDEFQKLMKKYHDDVTVLNTALQKISVNLDENRKGYTSDQEKTVQAISDITSKLQGAH